MSDEKKKQTKPKEFFIHELDAVKVVVYLDRAEVTRSLQTDVPVGENEIIVKELSEYLDAESIRVEGLGKASITDVSVHTDITQIEKEQEEWRNESDAKKAKLEEDLKEVEKSMTTVQKAVNRYQKERNVLDDFANLVTSKEEKKEFNVDLFDSFEKFLSTYENHAERIDDKLQKLNLEKKEIEEKQQKIMTTLQELRFKTTQKKTEQLSISLEATEAGQIQMLISYVVMNASWKPKYDIRVYSDDKSLKIHYYGLIRQTTTEDWTNSKLFLSSATPSIGGNVPEIGNFRLSLKPKYRSPRPVKAKGGLGFGGRKMKMAKSDFDMQEDICYDAEPMLMRACAMEPLQNRSSQISFKEQRATVAESTTSTTFEVGKLATIPSDNIEHKVSVGIIDLKPEFEYRCVPRKVAKAFLIAKVVNESNYAFLAGMANVFFDSNFVTKTEMKAVSSKEEFTCGLGVDASVKIDFKPEQKYKENTGWVLSKWTMETYQQDIVVKNTKNSSIHIIVTDRIPQSSDDKIKVNIIEPAGVKPIEKEKAETKHQRMNKDHNLEWEVDIDAGKENTLVLKYSIEHPASDEVDCKEMISQD